ncbi:MAG TPA: hypothetical protein VGN12_14440 [Pirellulales bacterium]
MAQILPRRHSTDYDQRPSYFFFFSAFLTAFAGALALADFAAGLAGFAGALAPFFLPLNTLSQFFENSGLGPERTIGPDMARFDSCG